MLEMEEEYVREQEAQDVSPYALRYYIMCEMAQILLSTSGHPH